jgi:hypothetical protein
MVEVLTSDATWREVALGWKDPDRMANDHKLVADHLGVEKPYDSRTCSRTSFAIKI